MAANRKQLSLIIRDDELFSKFVKPSAENGELNNIIIRCLSAYYYRAEVRNMIDGVPSGSSTEQVEVRSAQDSINDIRKALTLQSFYADSLQDELEAGIEDMTSILQRSTKMAEDEGYMKTEQGAYGNTVARITVQTSDSTEGITDFGELQKSMLSFAKSGNISGAFEASAKMQNELVDKLNQVISLLSSGQGAGVDLSNLSSINSTDEVSSFEPDVTEEIVEPSIETVEQEPVVVETSAVEPEPVIPEPKKEIDGSAQLANLLDSIGIG